MRSPTVRRLGGTPLQTDLAMTKLSEHKSNAVRQLATSLAAAAAIAAFSISPSVAAGGGATTGSGSTGMGREGGLSGNRGFGADRFVVGAGRSRSTRLGFERESRHCSPSLVERYSYGCSPLKVPYGPYGR